MTVARRIRVTGIVQGVGFRPFVWRLAEELGLTGWVRNDSEGVDIAVEGPTAALDTFAQRLHSEAPPLARVDHIATLDAPIHGHSSFTIAESAIPRGSQATPATASIGPDVATCPECLAELFDPSSRRWRHAFINCTHCGPRYTVTRHLPYDRPQTSLAPFPLCPDCNQEYTNPADRRFHAETTCCPQCGPRLALHDDAGRAIEGDPIAATLALLQAGRIVALKGLGGFHLACDARNAEAVAQLRQRKNREEKPFAVMVANAASLSELAQVGDAERALLEGRESPVVLLRKTPACDDRLPGIAPGIAWLGAMLPTTPIHFLLFHEAAGRPAGVNWLAAPQSLALVMTSANPGGEPIVRDNDEAVQRLAATPDPIADAILDHDRAIVGRCDDSVLRLAGNSTQFIRRSRGFTPTAIRLPRSGPSVLALGGHLKNTVCLTRGHEAFLSPHVGDLDNAATCAFLEETVARMIDLLEIQPERVAHDLHPDFFSTRFASDFAGRHGIPAVAVQHHAAHIAAVAAEHGVDGPLLGLALDGVGLGTIDDQPGGIWGGELLRLDGAAWQRLGHLAPLPLPGGDRAAREPWRMAAAALHRLGQGDEIARRWPQAGPLAQMLERQLNCPETSSAGRLFDAAAGLLGIKPIAAYEGQAAMLLEGLAASHESHGHADPWANGYRIEDNQIDFLPALAHLVGPIINPAQAAAQFHATLAAGLAEWTLTACRHTGITRVALGGGCFLNRNLSTALRHHLEAAGIEVLEARLAPPNDGGLALGQAWIALQTEL